MEYSIPAKLLKRGMATIIAFLSAITQSIYLLLYMTYPIACTYYYIIGIVRLTFCGVVSSSPPLLFGLRPAAHRSSVVLANRR
jgi:hypothetical protein